MLLVEEKIRLKHRFGMCCCPGCKRDAMDVDGVYLWYCERDHGVFKDYLRKKIAKNSARKSIKLLILKARKGILLSLTIFKSILDFRWQIK